MVALLALLSSALWGVADFVGGSLSRRVPVATVLGVSQLAALLILAPLAAGTGALDLPRSYLLPGLLGGLVGLVGLIAFYRALALGSMGVVAPIAALGVAVPVVAGVISGERPSVLQVAGMAVAVVGVVLASGPELSGGAGRAPLLLAGVAAVAFGTVFVLIAEGAEGDIDAVVMTLLTMRLTVVLLLTAALLALLPRRGADLGAGRGDLPALVLIGVADVGANAAFALSSRLGLVSVASVLASLYPVVTALLAYRLLGERLRRVQVVGAAITLIGVVLLAAG